MLQQLSLFFKITRSQGILRRYFIVNGFDGALTMLGIIVGFYMSDSENLIVVMNACFGAAIALGMSGLTSAYMSESAEQKKQLSELENAMIKDLEGSAYGQAARYLPLITASINSLSPFVISLIIISPIWIATQNFILPIGALESAMLIAFGIVFLLGVFLGYISKTNWLWSALRTLFIAIITASLVYLLAS